MGPPLASRVVFRQVQMPGADARIHAWLGIEISTATRHRTVQESNGVSGQVVFP